MNSFVRLAVGVLLCLASSAVGNEPESKASLLFERDVRPLLQSKCVRCHGGEKRQAELDVRTMAALMRGGESGPAVIAGQPSESLLVERIAAGDMPPEGEDPLTATELETIRKWISGGAKSTAPTVAAATTTRDVVPILLLRCIPCHGNRRQEGGLDLRTRDSILRGGKSGPAAIMSDPENSRIIQRIKSEEMPPRRMLVSASVKPMEAAELQKLEAWIRAGMPETDLSNQDAAAEDNASVTDEDRDFWSFKPPQRPDLPLSAIPGDQSMRLSNRVDVFIADKLHASGLQLSEEANRETLIRRVTFDLTGLPPTPDEIYAFVHDDRPAAYERLVDRLLASPQYGARWGRHWLDVAGYADSEGAQNEDRVRPNMWRYRDYVIRAFNADKPYDRFLLEQIAGDELADYEQAPEVTEEIYDNLVATGFLRTAPDRTFANITNFVPDRLEVIADEIQILGSAVLGLTIHCSRCHSHKFDPLPQRDYYRLAALLKDALDEHDWLGPEARHLKFVLPAERREWEQHSNQIEHKVAELRRMLESAPSDSEKSRITNQIQETEKQRRPEPTIRALWSRGEPSPTFLLRRGDYLRPGEEVRPEVPAVLNRDKKPLSIQPPWPGAKTTGRRLALARWLTTADHPLTTRVLVNRIWRHHFGIGIVSTLANFGRTGSPPSHPELLDDLSQEFVHSGWSIKALHRAILTSATYRQSSQVTEAVVAKDPENRLLSRMPLRRLEAEAARDSLLFVAGLLRDEPFGAPDEVIVRDDGLVTVGGSAAGERRSIFVLHRRTKLPTILDTFNSPQMGPNCIDRGESIVATQALHMLNNHSVHTAAGVLAERVRREAGEEVDRQIEWLWRNMFGRTASPDESLVSRNALAELTQKWQRQLDGSKAEPNEAAHRALQNYAHALLNSAAFLYVD